MRGASTTARKSGYVRTDPALAKKIREGKQANGAHDHFMNIDKRTHVLNEVHNEQ
jgi:hypothetical protein